MKELHVGRETHAYFEIVGVKPPVSCSFGGAGCSWLPVLSDSMTASNQSMYLGSHPHHSSIVIMNIAM